MSQKSYRKGGINGKGSSSGAMNVVSKFTSVNWLKWLKTHGSSPTRVLLSVIVENVVLIYILILLNIKHNMLLLAFSCVSIQQLHPSMDTDMQAQTCKDSWNGLGCEGSNRWSLRKRRLHKPPTQVLLVLDQQRVGVSLEPVSWLGCWFFGC